MTTLTNQGVAQYTSASAAYVPGAFRNMVLVRTSDTTPWFNIVSSKLKCLVPGLYQMEATISYANTGSADATKTFEGLLQSTYSILLGSGTTAKCQYAQPCFAGVDSIGNNKTVFMNLSIVEWWEVNATLTFSVAHDFATNQNFSGSVAIRKLLP